MSRSPDDVMALVMGVNVVGNFAFQPHVRVIGGETTGLLTLCNAYVNCLTAALGCAVPPLKANDQADWLEDPAHGWRTATAEDALNQGALGVPVVAYMRNEHGHGHIALVVPAPFDDPEHIYVTAAGVKNFLRTRIENSFGLNAPVHFATHD